MKITKITPIKLKYPYKKYIADGCTPCYARGAMLWKVETDTEIFGIGESATFGCSMEAMSEVAKKQLEPLLIDENPLDIERLFHKMKWNNWASGRSGIVMGAISGIDIALWDIMGKAAGMPLYRILGAHSDKVQGYASAGFYAPEKTVDDLKKEMDGYLAKGYSAFKMKVGRTHEMNRTPLRYMKNGDYTISFEDDIKRIEAVRQSIGYKTKLMIDMNCTWDVDTVIASESIFDQYRIFWIEEPVRTDDIAGYVKMTSSLKKTMVAGIESEQGLSRYNDLLKSGALDVVQANLGWAGGITEVRKIAALSVANNKTFTPHTFFSAVLNAANIHFAASLPNVPFIESEENYNPLRTDLLKSPIEVDGEMNYQVPQKPGLGIELDWDIVEQYAF